MTFRSPSNPFLAGPTIVDPKFFVGRKAELEAITTRMAGSFPVSVNVVGKGRIGISSLLYHFCQTYEQRVQNPKRYVAIYLNLENAHCQQENDFYYTIGREFFRLPKVRSQKTLTRPFHVKTLDRQTFSSVLGEWKRQGVLPVLCLDEFEVLFHYPKEFHNGFFDNLSFLMDSKILMLVIATHRNLNYYQRRYKLHSNFFKLAEVIRLGDLKNEEAEELLNLPVRTGSDPALTSEEQKLARQWGKNHPLLLQLAASLLWEARQQRQDISWVKDKFEEQAYYVPRTGFNFW